jgi:hypothetical protein
MILKAFVLYMAEETVAGASISMRNGR